MFDIPHTYAELLEKLKCLTPEQLKQNVTVYCAEQDEYFPVTATATAAEETNDVLDDGHFYLNIEA